MSGMIVQMIGIIIVIIAVAVGGSISIYIRSMRKKIEDMWKK